MDEINLETSLMGFCTLHNDLLYFREHGVLMRNDDDFNRHPERVMLVCGGGAGHEPGHMGFVGRGMLSSAISGNVFTSPSVTSCLAAILLANNPNRPVLVNICNYTGDRLNFGLAVEMARNVHGYRHVKLLVVDDDCSIEQPRQSTGRRGLAGVNLINKIAGAMSVKGASLDDIHDFCSGLLCRRLIRTIGFSFHHDRSNELSDIEIGYGIHGEPGSIKLEKEGNFKPIIGIMMKKLGLNDVNSDAVILFNNLGGASEYIFYQFVREFMLAIGGLSLRIVRVYAGKFLTSLSKEAISVTVMEVTDPGVMELLEMAVEVPCGHLFNQPLQLCNPSLREFKIPETIQREASEGKVTSTEVKTMQCVLEDACKASIAIKDYLNDVDSELGDGDTGSTLSRGAEAMQASLKESKIALDNPFEMLLQISSILMNSMGGTSGAIFSIFFQCAADSFCDANQHTVERWMSAVSRGIAGIAQHGKSSVGDRTLLDALHEGYSAMEERCRDTREPLKVLEAFAGGCRKGSESTKTMTPKSGRASYSLSDKGDDNFKSQHPDPGSHAISILSNQIYATFKRCIDK